MLGQAGVRQFEGLAAGNDLSPQTRAGGGMKHTGVCESVVEGAAVMKNSCYGVATPVTIHCINSYSGSRYKGAWAQEEMQRGAGWDRWGTREILYFSFYLSYNIYYFIYYFILLFIFCGGWLLGRKLQD
jgi:hypothetical protein